MLPKDIHVRRVFRNAIPPKQVHLRVTNQTYMEVQDPLHQQVYNHLRSLVWQQVLLEGIGYDLQAPIGRDAI